MTNHKIDITRPQDYTCQRYGNAIEINKNSTGNLIVDFKDWGEFIYTPEGLFLGQEKDEHRKLILRSETEEEKEKEKEKEKEWNHNKSIDGFLNDGYGNPDRALSSRDLIYDKDQPQETKKRKVVQIAFCIYDAYNPDLYALCDDGKIFVSLNKCTWEELPPIPQD
jgi:hypothetical protein